MLKNIICIGITSLCLSGCIGSIFVVDDADNEAKFPDLHKVPERPVIQERPQEVLTKEQLTETYQNELSENECLRQKYGL